jgi:hypothetical protein
MNLRVTTQQNPKADVDSTFAGDIHMEFGFDNCPDLALKKEN